MTRSARIPGAVCFLLTLAGGGERVRAQAPPPERASEPIAVLPFTNLSQDPADDWLGDGIAEILATDLAARGLSVTARARGPLAGDGDGPAPDLGPHRRRGARWAVSGGYRRTGRRLLVTARIVDLSTDEVVRTVTTDGEQHEIFALQDRLADEVAAGLSAGRLRARTTPALRPDAPTAPAPALSGSPPPAEAASAAGAIAGREPPETARIPGPATTRVPAPVGASVPGRTATGTVPERPGSAAGLGVASGAGVLTGRPAVRPERTAAAPRIDGALDDPLWERAVRINQFVQQRPLDGAPATEDTEVFVAYDDDNLYVGIHAHYSNRALVRANRADRDQTFIDDTVAVYLDPFLDQQRAYVFSVNGYGVQADSLLESSAERRPGGGGGGGGGGGRPGGGGRTPGSGRGGMSAALAASLGAPPIGDLSWDALFASAGRLVADGWTAEMAIPFKSLRYPERRAGEPHRWGFQIVRTIFGKDEADVWAPVSRGVAGFLTQMGLLDGLVGLSTSRNLEILPTVTAIRSGSLNAATGALEETAQPEGALNVKYGVTPNLTADFTYNPDFSQIESDNPQIEVNQRFPLFFPELRPFFLEGQEVFTVPGQVNLLHTRTIVDPRYGGKLTGKVGDTTLGVLVADDEAPGKGDGTGFGKTARVFAGRARYDLYSESSVGVVATGREFVDAYSRVAAVDGRFRLGRTSSLTMLYAQSLHRDDEGVERTGPTAHAAYDRQGRNLSYGAAFDTVDPDFRTDTGFVERFDTRSARANAAWRWWPDNLVINWGPFASYGRIYDFAGVRQDEQTSAGMRATLANGIITVANVNRDMERYGGIDFRKTSAFVGGGASASRKIAFGGFVNWGDQIRYGDDPFLGQSLNTTVFANLRPTSRLSTDLTFITSRLHDPLTDALVFDVKILRTFTTYQITNRLSVRNIMEYNSLNRTLDANILFTYRVNAGTVFFAGYDDHYQQGDLIDARRFPTTALRQTNRAFFTKLSYLFRY